MLDCGGDILKEQAEQQAELAEEQFDVDFTLMTGELVHLFADLLVALGGVRRTVARA